MTLTELRYIVAVAREKHFGRAADACYVSQPTLSVAIRKLEDQLGLQLFERSKTSIKVTPKGISIIAQAQKVLEEAEKIRQMAEESQDQLSGVMRVGSIFTIGPYLLPELVKQAKMLAPDMPLMLEEDYTADLRKKLRNGDLDAILIALPFNEAEVNIQTIYREPFVAVLPRDHVLAQKESLSLEELSQETLLLLGSGHTLRDQIVEACAKSINLEPGEAAQTILEGSSLEMIRQMVASGMGVSVFPISACQPAQMEDALVISRPFADESFGRKVGIAYRQSYPRMQAIDLLSQAIKSTQLHGINYL